MNSLSSLDSSSLPTLDDVLQRYLYSFPRARLINDETVEAVHKELWRQVKDRRKLTAMEYVVVWNEYMQEKLGVKFQPNETASFKDSFHKFYRVSPAELTKDQMVFLSNKVFENSLEAHMDFMVGWEQARGHNGKLSYLLQEGNERGEQGRKEECQSNDDDVHPPQHSSCVGNTDDVKSSTVIPRQSSNSGRQITAKRPFDPSSGVHGKAYYSTPAQQRTKKPRHVLLNPLSAYKEILPKKPAGINRANRAKARGRYTPKSLWKIVRKKDKQTYIVQVTTGVVAADKTIEVAWKGYRSRTRESVEDLELPTDADFDVFEAKYQAASASTGARRPYGI